MTHSPDKASVGSMTRSHGLLFLATFSFCLSISLYYYCCCCYFGYWHSTKEHGQTTTLNSQDLKFLIFN